MASLCHSFVVGDGLVGGTPWGEKISALWGLVLVRPHHGIAHTTLAARRTAAEPSKREALKVRCLTAKAPSSWCWLGIPSHFCHCCPCIHHQPRPSSVSLLMTYVAAAYMRCRNILHSFLRMPLRATECLKHVLCPSPAQSFPPATISQLITNIPPVFSPISGAVISGALLPHVLLSTPLILNKPSSDISQLTSHISHLTTMSFKPALVVVDVQQDFCPPVRPLPIPASYPLTPISPAPLPSPMAAPSYPPSTASSPSLSPSRSPPVTGILPLISPSRPTIRPRRSPTSPPPPSPTRPTPRAATTLPYGRCTASRAPQARSSCRGWTWRGCIG